MPALGAAVRTTLLSVLASFLVALSPAQTSTPTRAPSRPGAHSLTITVTDENGVAVPSAQVQLQPPPPALALRCQTDFAGRCTFPAFSFRTCDLRVEKVGFYAVTQANVQTVTPNLDVTLNHQREAREVIDVAESAPAIDPAQVSSKEELTGTEILDIPYPSTHDYRNALFFIPGITPDAFGQAHIDGAEQYQTLVTFDGFNVTQPANGELLVRSSVESFRSIEVTASREPAEYGKGSGGVLALNTRMGDNHFHSSAIDFIPDIQTVKGVSLGQWNPAYTISGPIHKGKTWFIDAFDGEYDNDIIPQLSSGSDSDHLWRVDNLAKLQSNFTARNIVTLSFLSNYYHDEFDGLSVLQPQSTTPTDVETAYVASLKDQYYFRDGALLETGLAYDRYTLALTPNGTGPYILTTNAAAGNYYLHENTQASRVQGLANLYLPPRQWHGRHDIKLGIDLDRLNYNALFSRQRISFLQPNLPLPGQTAQSCSTDSNGLPTIPSTCARYSIFSGGDYSSIYNSETSAYVQDRWLLTNRLLIEPGLRFDIDQIIRTPLLSPRLAGTYILDDEGNTKFSAGIGIIYDNTSLGSVLQPFEGQRVDYFFNPSGNPTDENGTPTNAPVPIPTTFTVNRNTLAEPRYLNWSLGLEKKLPHAVFLKLEFLEKRGVHGFAYNTLNGEVNGNFFLFNGRDDRYDAFQISARHRFRDRYEIFAAYTRSRAYTNQVFDFSLDTPLLSQQLPGPYPWDVPNRIIGWGILPFFNLPIIHKLDAVYSGEARTGLPFLATTDQGEIVPGDPPGTFRLPMYYTLNLQFEKRFHLFHRYWALRGGFDNITNHANVVLANGVIDSTHPTPTYIDGVGRAFTGRIRLLGKE